MELALLGSHLGNIDMEIPDWVAFELLPFGFITAHVGYGKHRPYPSNPQNICLCSTAKTCRRAAICRQEHRTKPGNCRGQYRNNTQRPTEGGPEQSHARNCRGCANLERNTNHQNPRGKLIRWIRLAVSCQLICSASRLNTVKCNLMSELYKKLQKQRTPQRRTACWTKMSSTFW